MKITVDLPKRDAQTLLGWDTLGGVAGAGGAASLERRAAFVLRCIARDRRAGAAMAAFETPLSDDLDDGPPF